MTVLNIVLAVLLFISAIFLIVAVLLQSGKDKGVSGAITGGSSETYFGKNKGKSFDKKLSLITTIVAIVFVVLALVTFITQDYINQGSAYENIFGSSSTTTTTTKAPATTNSSTTDSSSTDSSSTDSSSTDSSSTDNDSTDSSSTDNDSTDSSSND